MERNWREERDNGEAEEKASLKPLFFPPEIITEIGLRLPSKSIGRLRCVSKTFCSLLSDRNFTKKQLHRTLENESRQRRLLISSNNLLTVDVDAITDGCGGASAAELDYPLKEDLDLLFKMKSGTVKYKLWGGTELTFDSDSRPLKRKWVEIVGFSNGTACVPHGDQEEEEEVVDIEIHGFGFDALTDDYKVVKFVACNDGDLSGYVYSLRADTWRRINNLRYAHVRPLPGVLLDGAIHWVVEFEDGRGQNERVVAAFDLQTEEFRELSLPEEAEGCEHVFMKLEVGILKGCLCVFYSCYETHDVLWVMDEYSVKRSWRKIRISVSYFNIKPLCSTKNDDEAIIKVDSKLVLYNFESNTSSNVEISGVDLGAMFEAVTYFESLISPNAYGIDG